MTQHLTAVPSSRRPRLSVAAAAVAVLVLSACSASGDDPAAVTTSPAQTTAVAPATTGGASTTTESETTTTRPAEDDTALTVAELSELLPTADEVGFDFEEVPVSESEADPAFDAAMLEACPGAAEFFSSEDSPSAEREFEAPDGRTISVELDPTPKNLDDDVLDSVIDVMNSCGTVSYTATNGSEVQVVMSAERNDELGDRGVLVQQDITISHSSLAEDVAITQGGWIFLYGSIGVQVRVADGIGDDGTVTPAEFEVVGDIALELVNALRPLLED